MTLRAKQNAWGAGLITALLAVIFATAEPTPLSLVIASMVFLVLAILQYRWFRCPSCGQMALPPAALTFISVGTKCRHCGNSY